MDASLSQIPVIDPKYFNLEYIFFLFYKFVDYIGDFFVGFGGGINLLKTFLTLLCILLIAVIIYATIRIWELEKEQEKIVNTVIVSDPTTKPKSSKWENVQKHIASGSEGDWRIAIIEADTMLDELTQSLGFAGDDLGERLKSANVHAFKYLNEAWEVHKMRNRIAHDGSNFVLSRPEAQRAVDTYELIFRDAGII